MCHSVTKSQDDNLQAFEVCIALRRDVGKVLADGELDSPALWRQNMRPMLVLYLTPEIRVPVSWHKCDTCCRRTRLWQLVLCEEKSGQEQEESLTRRKVTSVSSSTSTFFSYTCS